MYILGVSKKKKNFEQLGKIVRNICNGLEKQLHVYLAVLNTFFKLHCYRGIQTRWR